MEEISKSTEEIAEVEDVLDVSNKYINREKSWIDFNYRILDLCKRSDIPFLERLNFLSITEGNLYEFIMVRLGSIYEKIKAEYPNLEITGMNPHDEFIFVRQEIKKFISDQASDYVQVESEMQKNNIRLLKYKDLNEEQLKIVGRIFKHKIFSALTPMAIDAGRPFPNISSKTINLAAIVEDKTFSMLCNLTIPDTISRLIFINKENEINNFILLEEVIINKLDKIFVNKKVSSYGLYSVMRNADINVNLMSTNELLVDKMRTNVILRDKEEILIVKVYGMEKELQKILSKSLDVRKENFMNLESSSCIDFGFCSQFKKLLPYAENLKYKKFKPQYPEQLIGEKNIFEAIDKGDIMIHHPYESFDAVVNFIEDAAEDPDVIAIKQTIYRVGEDSKIVKALEKAVTNGKQVTVLFEVLARFDETNNMNWAAKLERQGCHVIYGVEELKTHCKMTLVIRKNIKGNLKKYVHIGTGNYNDVTSNIYTDLSYFTSNQKITDDVISIFNVLTGFSEQPSLNRIIYSPVNLRDSVKSMILKEIDNAKNGISAGIIFKINSLEDKEMIDLIYQAAESGVKVELIVRGICSLVKRENITIKSIVGRFLEHSRIYSFENAGKREIFIASADLMSRNLDKRFEVAVPIKDIDSKYKIEFILQTMLKDTYNSYFMDENGNYSRIENVENEFNCHDEFIKNAIDKTKVKTFVRFK